MSGKIVYELSVLSIVTLLATALCAENFLIVTNKCNSGKFAQTADLTKRIGFHVLLDTVEGAIANVDRKTFDAHCRRLCLFTNPPGSCRMAQTCWSGFALQCELYSVSTCSPSSPAYFASEGPESRHDCHIWEFNLPTDPEPTKACAEYVMNVPSPDCSYCNKRGYFGPACVIPSTCAATFYENGYNLLPLFWYTSWISPCFANGNAILAPCLGPFTRWWSLTDGIGQWQDSRTTMNYATFLAVLPEQLSRVQRSCSGGKLFQLMISSNHTNYSIYSGVSIGANWSLTIGSYQGSTLNSTSKLPLPIVDAPWLQPLNPNCGPMWRLQENVFYNATHIDSCAMSYTFFGTPSNTWEGEIYSSLSVLIDIEVYGC